MIKIKDKKIIAKICLVILIVIISGTLLALKFKKPYKNIGMAIIPDTDPRKEIRLTAEQSADLIEKMSVANK